MDADSWLWVALIAFLVFCCLPMVLMGRHHRRSGDKARGEVIGEPSGSPEKTTRRQ